MDFRKEFKNELINVFCNFGKALMHGAVLVFAIIGACVCVNEYSAIAAEMIAVVGIVLAIKYVYYFMYRIWDA